MLLHRLPVLYFSSIYSDKDMRDLKHNACSLSGPLVPSARIYGRMAEEIYDTDISNI